MKLAVWALEWRLVLTRRRYLVLGAALPLALVLPVATGAVAADETASVYAVLFAAFAAMGSAIPLRWEGARGMSARVVMGGMSAPGYLLQRAAAGAALDLVQLTPALVVAALAAHASVVEALVAYVGLAATVWIAGLLGVVAAAITRSIAEAILVTTVIVVSFAEMSGVFYTPRPGSFGALLEAISPFRALHEALLDMTVGAPTAGGLAELVWVVLLPVAIGVAATRLHAALGQVGRYGLEGV